MNDVIENSEESIEFDEIYEARGIRIARIGRFIRIDNVMRPEDRRDFLDSVEERKQALLDDLERQVLELEEIIEQFNPFDILGNIKYRNAVLNAEEYKEHLHDGSDAFTEYLTLLYLTRKFDSYPEIAPPFSGETIEDIQSRINNLFNGTILYFGIMDVTPDQDEKDAEVDVISMLRFETLSRSLKVRYMYYHHHLKEYLTILFSPINEEIKKLLGVTIEEAISISEFVNLLESKRLFEKGAKAKEYAKDLRKAVKIYRQKGRLIGDYSEEIVQDLANLKPSESAKRIMGIAAMWIFWALDRLFLFTAEEISQESGLPIESISKYLNHMSLEFGSVDKFFRHPRPTHPLMTKSYVKFDDRFFCPVYQSQVSNLQPVIENLINPDSELSLVQDNKIWNRYSRVRGEFLESQSVNILSNALNSQQAYQNLRYSITEDGEAKSVELDGLIIHDTSLVLIETKAGTFSLPARRGAPKRIQKDLQELVDDAFNQCLRAKEYIKANDSVTFELENDQNLSINRNDFSQIFLVNVTLEILDAFVTNTYYLQDLGLLDENEHLWSIALTDLRVICEMIEFPSQLIHYLQRRLRINEFSFIRTFDELDWFGHYLLEGLYFEDVDEHDKKIIIQLGSYTTMFDDYYLYESGQTRKPVEKPRQEMPELLRSIIFELEANRPRYYSEAICKLLEGDTETRESFIEGIRLIKQKAIADDQLHDFSIIFTKPSFGITYMSGPMNLDRELYERLVGYCIFKKYQTKCDFWVGLASTAQSPYWASSGIVLNDAWEYNEEMEREKRITEETLGIQPFEIN